MTTGRESVSDGSTKVLSSITRTARDRAVAVGGGGGVGVGRVRRPALCLLDRDRGRGLLGDRLLARLLLGPDAFGLELRLTLFLGFFLRGDLALEFRPLSLLLVGQFALLGASLTLHETLVAAPRSWPGDR